MKDRTRLLIGVGVSLVFHGVLFATVPAWGSADVDEVGEGPEQPSIEVVTLDPDMVREILEPRVRPAMASPLDAPSEHAPTAATPWPTLQIERPAAEAESALRENLLPITLDTPSVTHPPIVDLLQSVSPVPAVDVTPPPAPDPAPVVQESGPPAIAGFAGLVTHREPLSYPLTAERRGIEGVASLAVEVGEDGTVVTTRVLKSSGHRVLDRAAQRNLKRWKFDPAAVRAAGRGRVFRQDVQFQID